jgi:hypothetical protein
MEDFIMKINQGKDVCIEQALVFTRGEEKMILREGAYIEVITDETDYDKTYTGEYKFIEDQRIKIDDENIPIDYIVEIKIIEE